MSVGVMWLASGVGVLVGEMRVCGSAFVVVVVIVVSMVVMGGGRPRFLLVPVQVVTGCDRQGKPGNKLACPVACQSGVWADACRTLGGALTGFLFCTQEYVCFFSSSRLWFGSLVGMEGYSFVENLLVCV